MSSKKIIVPQGLINPNETTIIEIPAGVESEATLIARARPSRTHRNNNNNNNNRMVVRRNLSPGSPPGPRSFNESYASSHGSAPPAICPCGADQSGVVGTPPPPAADATYVLPWDSYEAPAASYSHNTTPNATYSLNNSNATYSLNNPNATYSVNNPNATYSLNNPNATYAVNNANATYAVNNANATYAVNNANATYSLDRSYNPNETYNVGQSPNATYSVNNANATYSVDRSRNRTYNVTSSIDSTPGRVVRTTTSVSTIPDENENENVAICPASPQASRQQPARCPASPQPAVCPASPTTPSPPRQVKRYVKRVTTETGGDDFNQTQYAVRPGTPPPSGYSQVPQQHVRESHRSAGGAAGVCPARAVAVRPESFEQSPQRSFGGGMAVRPDSFAQSSQRSFGGGGGGMAVRPESPASPQQRSFGMPRASSTPGAVRNPNASFPCGGGGGGGGNESNNLSQEVQRRLADIEVSEREQINRDLQLFQQARRRLVEDTTNISSSAESSTML